MTATTMFILLISRDPIERVTEKGIRTTCAITIRYHCVCHGLSTPITVAYDRIAINALWCDAVRECNDGSFDIPPSASLTAFRIFSCRLCRIAPPPPRIFRAVIETRCQRCKVLLQHVGSCATRARNLAGKRAGCTAHVATMYEIMLMRKAKSWVHGYNSNVAGHEEGNIPTFLYNNGRHNQNISRSSMMSPPRAMRELCFRNRSRPEPDLDGSYT